MCRALVLLFVTLVIATRSIAQDIEPSNTRLPPASPPVPSWSGWYAPLSDFEPQTQSERFMEYAILTFGPRALVLPIVPASLKMMARDHSYGSEAPDGWDALGRHYGDGLARMTALQTGRYLTGALTHEDYRYRPSRRTNKLARV